MWKSLDGSERRVPGCQQEVIEWLRQVMNGDPGRRSDFLLRKLFNTAIGGIVTF
jgi:hypothetical protein